MSDTAPRPFPEQDQMVAWFADKEIPAGFDAVIDTQGRLSFVAIP